MASIKGSLKFKPGVNMRRYLPNTVITAIVPCFTVTNDENTITKTIKTKINKVIWAVMASLVYKLKIILFIGVLFVFT